MEEGWYGRERVRNRKGKNKKGGKRKGKKDWGKRRRWVCTEEN